MKATCISVAMIPWDGMVILAPGTEECPMSFAANYVAVITGAEIAGDLVGMM